MAKLVKLKKAVYVTALNRSFKDEIDIELLSDNDLEFLKKMDVFAEEIKSEVKEEQEVKPKATTRKRSTAKK